ncbi:c-type cytochrome [Mangrovibacterium diazotrophicum]|uniref:Cytochrome c n=1 Tax=Mangrovibacterium diazotrophicum TaxID=1261403 RepID=A0A419VYW8_9BACT|nr:c-type cytochrome [Mangrovibacterium diazotrophicum]RKD88435.1 cytochrome c [Mangrovibacterium diazotrophicum]
MSMKKCKVYLLIALLGLAFSACVYDFEAVEVIEEIPDTQVISFSETIIPIFESKCTSCHKVGGIKPVPDLTAANAYNSINSSTYINATTPENSLIYTKPSPDGSHSAKYTRQEAAFVLAWINQGAQDN